jgi:hypothetical protein
MTKVLSRFIVLALLGFLVGSCYKDKGNYTYTDINKVSITAPDTVSVVLPDSLKIDVTLAQTMPDAAGLKFEWVIYPITQAPLTRRTLDTTQSLKVALSVAEPPGSYYLDYFVTDKKTAVIFRKRFVVNILSKYSEGWMVIEESGGGCDVSMISPTDAVFRNVYSGANKGSKLPAGTARIPDVKTNRNVQYLYVLSPGDMVQANFADFVKIAGVTDLFWQAPSPVKPQEYFVNGDAELMLNNGKPHTRNLITSGIQKLNLPPVGNYYMAPFEMYTIGSGYVLFDTIAQKFLKLDQNTVTLLPFAAAPSGSFFDLNNIGKRLLYLEANILGQFTAIFKNSADDSLFAYLIKPEVAQTAYARYDGLNAPGLSTAKLLVNSRTLPHLYYASGNQIYKLDIPAKTATPIYTFPAGTEIRAMKMYRNLKLFSDPNNNRLMAVATLEAGNQGKVYYFPIGATGSFTNNTYSKVFTGFGQINEITFKSQK